MTNIRRYVTIGRPVFITAVCHQRRPYLDDDMRKELLLSVMREVKASSLFSMQAYVILDDHFHWIITPKGQPFPKVMQSIKLRFNYRFKKTLVHRGKLSLWQRRYWDHLIRDSEDMHRHMDYIHFNPVRHGYVAQPVDYPWSSFSTHVELGNYDLDWGTQDVPDELRSMDFE
jgi:putative transposase